MGEDAYIDCSNNLDQGDIQLDEPIEEESETMCPSIQEQLENEQIPEEFIKDFEDLIIIKVFDVLKKKELIPEYVYDNAINLISSHQF